MLVFCVSGWSLTNKHCCLVTMGVPFVAFKMQQLKRKFISALYYFRTACCIKSQPASFMLSVLIAASCHSHKSFPTGVLMFYIYFSSTDAFYEI